MTQIDLFQHEPEVIQACAIGTGQTRDVLCSLRKEFFCEEVFYSIDATTMLPAGSTRDCCDDKYRVAVSWVNRPGWFQ